MRWWHWTLIACVAFAVGLWAGGVALAGGSVAGIALLMAGAWRDSADRGLEWAEAQRRKAQAENLERNRAEDNRRAMEAAANGAATARRSPAPMSPPKSRHLDGAS